MNAVLDAVLAWLDAIDPWVRILVAGIGIMLETSILIGLVIPGDTIVVVTALGVRTVPEYVILLVVVIVGALIGESIGFALGRWLGPKIETSWLGRKLGTGQIRRAERYLARRGGPAIFISRFLPVLHALVPFTVGMSGMRYRRFLLWTLPACIVWALLYVTVGFVARGAYEELSRSLHNAGYVIVGVAVVVVIAVVLVKRRLERSQERFLTEHRADAVESSPGTAAPGDAGQASSGSD